MVPQSYAVESADSAACSRALWRSIGPHAAKVVSRSALRFIERSPGKKIAATKMEMALLAMSRRIRWRESVSGAYATDAADLSSALAPLGVIGDRRPPVEQLVRLEVRLVAERRAAFDAVAQVHVVAA